ncbi:hypothetical protein [Micromonospora sp. NPDC005161]
MALAASGVGLGAADALPAGPRGLFVAVSAVLGVAALAGSPLSPGVSVLLLAGPVEPVSEPAAPTAAPVAGAGPVDGAGLVAGGGPVDGAGPVVGVLGAAPVVDGVGRASSAVPPGASGVGGSAGGGQLGRAGAQPDAAPEGPVTPQPPGAGTAPVSDG